jgi:hypothetical protein
MHQGQQVPWDEVPPQRATLVISSREILGIHSFRWGAIPFKVDMKWPQRLGGGIGVIVAILVILFQTLQAQLSTLSLSSFHFSHMNITKQQ